jgi:hypothetical protein
MTLVGDFVTGTNVPYQRLRALLQTLEGMQEGVVGAGDLKPAQRAVGGPNMSVDIAPGDAWIDVDSGVRSGRAHCYSDALENRAVAASHATLPRIDLVIMRYNDTSIPAGAGGNAPTLEVLTGAPTGGVTLDAPGASPQAMPNDAILLATILVPAASTSVVAANIRDRRKWARGMRRRMRYTAGNLTSASTVLLNIDGTLQIRAELSGVLTKLSLLGEHSVVTAGDIFYNFAVGAGYADGRTDGFPFRAPTGRVTFAVQQTFVPAAGSNIIVPQWQGTTANTRTLYAGATAGLEFLVEEQVAQNADNT